MAGIDVPAPRRERSSMAGYSGTPLPRKLGIADETRLGLFKQPEGFLGGALGALPAAVRVADAARARGPFDVIVAFFAARRELEKSFDALKGKLDFAGGLWIAWPKKASGVATDMTEDVVRAVALPRGLVDNKVCAIDEVWSGLRLVYRVAARPDPGKAKSVKAATKVTNTARDRKR